MARDALKLLARRIGGGLTTSKKRNAKNAKAHQAQSAGVSSRINSIATTSSQFMPL